MAGSAAKPRPLRSSGAGVLSKKAGGIPVWGWGAGVLVAILVGLYFRNRNASGAQATTAPTDAGTAQAPANAVTDGSADTTGLADTIAALGDRLTAAETQLAFGYGAYEPPVDSGFTWPDTWAVPRNVPGATDDNSGGATVKGLPKIFRTGLGARAGKGPEYVQPAVPDKIFSHPGAGYAPGGVVYAPNKRKLTGLGSTVHETHTANSTRAVKIANGVLADSSARRTASKLPAFSGSQYVNWFK